MGTVRWLCRAQNTPYALVVCASLAVACSGKVTTIDPEEDPSGAGGADFGSGGNTGGFGTGGYRIGTGGQPDEPYEEPECPDEPPPPIDSECDPLDPEGDCGPGEGCYPYLTYPYGEQCGHPTFGAYCATASTGEQGDFCGDGGNYCAPGYMCVVGAAGGKRCGKICAPVKDHGCPAGLICGETDIQGYGVCF